MRVGEPTIPSGVLDVRLLSLDCYMNGYDGEPTHVWASMGGNLLATGCGILVARGLQNAGCKEAACWSNHNIAFFPPLLLG